MTSWWKWDASGPAADLEKIRSALKDVARQMAADGFRLIRRTEREQRGQVVIQAEFERTEAEKGRKPLAPGSGAGAPSPA